MGFEGSRHDARQSGTVYGSTKELGELPWEMENAELRTTCQFWRHVTFPSVGFMKIKRIAVRSAAGPYTVVCGASGQLDWRQDRGEFAGREEAGGGILPAEAGSFRSRGVA